MPELHSGMTGEFRAFRASREVDLGRKLEEFIAQAVPDVLHIWVLARLVEAGKAGCSVSEAAKGIAQVGLQTQVPTIFGVITADNLEQAIERAGSKQGNQGAKSMLAAIEMVNLFKKLDA